MLDRPEDCARYAEDAAHYPGGSAVAVALPADEAEVSAAIRQARRVLPVGAQSSLTGGATPQGDVVLSTAHLLGITELRADRVRVGAGVSIAALQDALAARGAFFPPVPTFTGATAGGVVSTNAAGAATFKYGTTRTWVEGLTVVLASGHVLEIARGEVAAHPDGYFDIVDAAASVRVPAPRYSMPAVPKCSAGYFAGPGMDLVDLFVGSEGTLGVVTDVTFRVIPTAPTLCFFFVTIPTEDQGIGLVRCLRDASIATWATADARGIDVCAIEHLDRRCLELLREDGMDRRHAVSWPADTALALLIQMELPDSQGPDRVADEIAGALSADAPDTPLTRICRLFDELGLLDRIEAAPPGSGRRVEDFVAIREAVPSGVNRRIAETRRTIDARIEKTAADMIVPFARFADLMAAHRAGFERRQLDYAVWGHISDGNVHPNVLPRSFRDVEAGRAAILEVGHEVVRLGGSPLAEHGVGRSPVKQTLLRQLYGETGVDEMRAVKRALDPDWKLAPGVLFRA